MKKLDLLAMLFITTIAFGQIKIFTNIGADEGLCQSHVFCMLQDRDGYMWFGTYDGVSRWDGHQFYNYRESDGLAGATVFCMGLGPDSTVYFGTSKGLSGFRNGGFFPIPGTDSLSNKSINAVLASRDGCLYMAVQKKGLYVLKNGRLTCCRPEKGDFKGRIFTLFEAQDSSIYISTLHGLYRQQLGTIRPVPELATGRYSDIWQTLDGTLYIGSVDSGLYVMKGSSLQHIGMAQGLSDSRVYSIRSGPDSCLFVTTFGGGVNILRGNQIEVITEKHGLAHNNVFTCMVSEDGTIFFGTVAGISLYTNSRFQVYNKKSGLANNYIISLFLDSDGNNYLGTYGSGVDIIHRGVVTNVSTRDGLGDDHVNAIVKYKGEILFGTWRGIYAYRDGTIRPFPANPFLKSRDITHMMVGRDSTLWIATADAVTLVKDSRVRHLTEADGLQTNDQDLIYEGNDGTIYFASERGVQTWRNGRIDTLSGVTGYAVHALYENSRGMLYIGTDKGLVVREHGKNQRIIDGLTHPSIYGISEDRDGRLYLATQRGVSVLDYTATPPVFRSIRYRDGLASDECSEKACCRDAFGRLWFGSIRGITCYDPQREHRTGTPPAVYIKRMRLFEQDLSLTTKHVAQPFRHDQNYFKFDFVGINFLFPHKVRYRYRMWGVDPDWVETGQNFVQYTNLSDGQYRFQVMAKHEWGPWSQPAEMSFSIRPPFWQTWWFMSITIILGAATLAGLIMLRYRHLLALERLRTRIAADLHDRIGSGLTEISILSEVHAKQVDDKAKTVLKKIGNIAQGLMDNMSDIVWLINPHLDSLLDLLIRLKDSCEDVTTCLGITLHTERLKDVANVRLPMEYRQNLYLIMKEAINNCLKHSQCREIFLEAQVANKKLHVILRDDGCGFNGSSQSNGNGLYNMRHRAETIGGSLFVQSNIGQGTLIEFTGNIQG